MYASFTIIYYYILRWIYHHYLAMVMALISLTWEIKGQPDCSSKQVYSLLLFLDEALEQASLGSPPNLLALHSNTNLLQRGVQLFLRWAIMQGIAMHLQNRYQRQRLRTRIALGKVRSCHDSRNKSNQYTYTLQLWNFLNLDSEDGYISVFKNMTLTGNKYL